MLVRQLEPQAAYPTGTGLSQLHSIESFVIVLARLWAAKRIEPDQNHPDWRDGFLAAGVNVAGAASFDSFLNIIETAAVRRIELGCPQHAQMMEDEADLLCAIALVQHRREAEAALVLADWLPPTTLCIAMSYAKNFAVALTAADMRLPLRNMRLGRSQAAIEVLDGDFAGAGPLLH